MLSIFIVLCVAEKSTLREAEVETISPVLHREHHAESSKLPVRNHEDWAATSSVSYHVLQQALLDPFALACLFLLVAYAGMNKMLVKPKPGAADVASNSSGRSTRKSRAPDRFALVVNQKLTKLDTVDEVLDFALASAETGRTDIVNAVTAIHRSAKLASHLPMLQRIRFSQDPRMRTLLDQLLMFINAGGHSSQILSRACGNTSWALAKLQFRQDPEKPHAILEALQGLFVQHCTEFKPEELMNTVWAFGELRRDKDSADSETRALAVATAACKCMAKFDHFTLQQVVYFGWALARLSSISGVRHEGSDVRRGLLAYVTRIVDRVRPEAAQLNPKNLAMLSWAIASLFANLGLTESHKEGTEVSSLMVDIAGIAQRKGLWGFQPGEVASILWAVNKVHVNQPLFYAFIRDHLLQIGLDGFNTQDIATILCAFVKTGHGNDTLYEMLSQKATRSAKDFNRSEKMMLSWAFSQLPHVTAPEL
jgi:hypothetical protein